MGDTPTKTFSTTSKVLDTDYPLIDNDPLFSRVVGYARTSDYIAGGIAASAAPAGLLFMEKFAPSHVGQGGFPKMMRLAGAVGLVGGFLYFYNRSISRFYGINENAREVQMDVREMVNKVKAGEPLYGVSSLSPHMQGVAARQSRYSSMMSSVIPWFNFVNHDQHGVDTAKYYQQAERELESEGKIKSS